MRCNVCEVINIDGVADAPSGVDRTDLCRDVPSLQALLTQGSRKALVAVTGKNAEFPVLQVRGYRLPLAARHVFVDHKRTVLLRISRANQEMRRAGLRVLFQHGKFGFVGADVFGLTGNGFDLFGQDTADAFRGPRLNRATEVLRCQLINRVGAANYITAMHRDAARRHIGVLNHQIGRGLTPRSMRIRHRHGCRSVRVHGAVMRAGNHRARELSFVQ